MPDRARGFGSSVAWMAAGNWVEQAIGFVVYLALARILGVEEFGLAAMASSFVILAEFLVRGTLTEWLISETAPGSGDFDAVFWVLGAFSLALYGAIYFGAGLIAGIYGAPEVAPIIQVLAIVVPMTGLSAVPVVRLRRASRFDVLGFRAMAGMVAGGAVGLPMALMGWGVWALVGFRVALVFTNEAIAWVAARWRPGGWGRFGHLRGFLSMGLATLWLQAAHLVSIQSATVIFGATLGPVAAGYFALSWRVIEIVTALVNLPLAMVSQTAFAAARRRGEDVTAFMDAVLRVTTLISLAVFAGLAMLAGPFVGLAFGAEWLPAVPLVQILCLVGLYKAVERIQHVFCLASGRAQGLAVITTVEALVGIAAMLAVVRYGAEAVAWAFTLRFLLLWPLRFVYAQTFGGVGLGQFGAILLPGLLGAGVMAAALAGLTDGLGFDPFRLPVMVLAVLLGAAVFAGFVLIFMPGRLGTARALLAFQTAGPEGLEGAGGLRQEGADTQGSRDAGP